MKIKASLHIQNGDGILRMIDSGECLAYSPDTRAFKVHDPYVSLNFGKYRIHLNKEDFTKFCKQFLGFSVYDTNKEGKDVPLLRQG